MSPTDCPIALEPDKLCEDMDLASFFSRCGPLHIEIGSGKGTFLVNQARAHPENNYLGIEWANKYYLYSVDRMRRWNISNVRILRYDARDFFRCFLPAESVDTLHVYFPDPWPKKRHQKRRFFHRENIMNVARCLSRQGQLRTATDHKEYYQVIVELMLNSPDIAPMFEQVDFYPVDTADPGQWVGSNFERKYIQQRRQIYTLALRKL